MYSSQAVPNQTHKKALQTLTNTLAIDISLCYNFLSLFSFTIEHATCWLYNFPFSYSSFISQPFLLVTKLEEDYDNNNDREKRKVKFYGLMLCGKWKKHWVGIKECI